MSIKHKGIDIPLDDPFKNCKLDRAKYANVLTSIASSYAEGFVLAINNEWGTGKTTFVKMWQQQLCKEGFKSLYFNAWENDFDNNPLVALMSEMKSLSNNAGQVSFKSLLKKGAILSKSLLPSIVEAIAEKYISTKVVSDAIKNATEAALDILKNEIDEYADKKKGLLDFKNELEKYISKNTTNKPVIFIIDELDRCKPNYSVEVLEQIKHFFNVPGIVFVLAIDKKQLCSAIKGFYGSEEIDANEYLRRFIDLEYHLANPEVSKFCEYLYDFFSFEEFLESEERKKIAEFREEKISLIRFSTEIFREANLNLRQQEQIYAHTRVTMNLLKSNHYIFPTVYIFLIFLRFKDFDLYNKIKNRLLTPQSLLKEAYSYFKNYSKNEDINIFFIEAMLLHLYFNYYREINSNEKIMTFDKERKQDILLINSSFENEEANSEILRFLQSFNRSNVSRTGIGYLLKVIDLTENLSF